MSSVYIPDSLPDIAELILMTRKTETGQLFRGEGNEKWLFPAFQNAVVHGTIKHTMFTQRLPYADIRSFPNEGGVAE